MLLLVGMFVAVHRGARGHQIAEHISAMEDGLEAAAVRRSEFQREIEFLRSRPRVTRAAEPLGLHLPAGDEFVILDLRGAADRRGGGSL
jgi:hypothetical protein